MNEKEERKNVPTATCPKCGREYAGWALTHGFHDNRDKCCGEKMEVKKT